MLKIEINITDPIVPWEVRCRLVAAQRATSGWRKLPFMLIRTRVTTGLGRRLRCVPSRKDRRCGVRSPATRHVATGYCWKLNRAMNGTRTASRARSWLVRDTLVRDGATTVDAVPLTFMHNDRCVVTTHGDDFIAAGCQQGLDSLTRTMENNFHTKSLGRIGPSCRQKSGTFF